MDEHDLECGDIVVVNEYGKVFDAIIVAKGTNNQPLIVRTDDLKNGCYRPFWSTYEAIIDNPYHVSMTKILRKALEEMWE